MLAPMQPEANADALNKVRQVFRFLEAFAELNVPLTRRISEQLWSLDLSALPTYPTIELGEVQLMNAGEKPSPRDEVIEDAPLLRVRRPQTNRPPRPTSLIGDWLMPGWDDPRKPVEVMPTRNIRRGSEIMTESFAEDPERTRAFQEWRSRWEKWAEAERPARAAMRIFEQLYELKGRLELEGERVELMLGAGRLRWRVSAGEIDHPILLQRVELQFDADVPELRMVDADRPPELYAAVLHEGDRISAETFNRLRQEIETGGFHPLSTEPTTLFLRRLVQQLSPRGRFTEAGEATDSNDDPVISVNPILFLRPRVTGFSAAFEHILEDLETRGHLPTSLTRLVGVTPPVAERPSEPVGSPWGEPPDVLLSKPANPEQVQVARALERYHAVLVQGPPGTGKTHTIANLIGHLVAQGNRVLVTSHTAKALRVVRDQLVESLRPLCVAVLDNDLESRSQMEQSVRGILSRLTTAHEESLGREVATLTKLREELNAEIDSITCDLRDVREAEYRPIVLAGEPVAPSDAARWVTAHTAGNDWIPGPLEPGAPLPLDHDDLVFLHTTTTKLTTAEEEELEDGTLDTRALPDVTAFRTALTDLTAHEPPDQARYWTRAPSVGDLADLEDLSGRIADAARELASMQPWQRHLIGAGHSRRSERDLWIALDDLIGEAVHRWEEARPVLIEYEVHVSAATSETVSDSVAQVVAHLEGGGSLGWLTLRRRRRWKEVVDGCTVNGQRPRDITHFKALSVHFAVEEARRMLAVRWTRQAEVVGLPPFTSYGHPPEPALKDHALQFRSLLEWWKLRWDSIEALMDRLGFCWREFREYEIAKSAPSPPFERDAALLAGPLQSIVRIRTLATRRARACELLLALHKKLEPHRKAVGKRLLRAISERDGDGYQRALHDLLDLASKETLWRRRKELLKRLARVAPTWAEQLSHRKGIHAGPEIPGDARAAWRWRQLQQEIERRASLNEASLNQKLEQRRAELRATTEQLIDRRAWLAQLKRTDLRARQALQGWADTQKKIGKGTGKRVPALQAKARELLAQARDAVPVWVMPLARVAESFDPRRGRMDVVIVDEASQSDVTGLLCWYLGDRVAVVGDHEQVSPLAVGQQYAPVEALISEHLGGIPNNHLYDGRTSIYDLARQCFGGTIALREHFRCVPDIIEFSNGLSYNGEIRPLRNPATAPRPHVVEYVVQNGRSVRSGKANLSEARIIAALVKAACELPEYRGKTMGAIALLGDEQAGLIQDLVIALVGAVELESRRFIAGNAAQFQGDERSIMFLSMVDVPIGAPLRMRQTDAHKQRYNVAASRAQDQLWLVHSLDPAHDLQPGDLRALLIGHVRDPSARQRKIQAAQSRAQSPFEEAVISRLINAGYSLRPQHWVGHYRIDMVITDGDKQIALECDGDRFHGTDQIPHDMARQAILERAGWRFIRVRGTRFFRDPDATMAWLFREFEKAGIGPARQAMTHESPDEASGRVRERLVLRAHEIMEREGWLVGGGNQDGGSDGMRELREDPRRVKELLERDRRLQLAKQGQEHLETQQHSPRAYDTQAPPTRPLGPEVKRPERSSGDSTGLPTEKKRPPLPAKVALEAFNFGVYQVESGLTKYDDWRKPFVEALGAAVEPYLKPIWNNIKTRRPDLAALMQDQ
jgi:very-short-patch-repair endonuclease